MQIQEPVVLAKLPRPFHDSQHKYGPVFGLAAGQKKKRHEVTVAIDGNSVSIYEIEHGSIKASYAIPPTATFLCSPISIRMKTGKHSFTRYTYCVTKREARRQLQYFEERFENDQSQGITSSSTDVTGKDGDIAYLEAVAETSRQDSHSHSLHALHQTGILTRYSSNLQNQEQSLRLDQLVAAEGDDVLAARWLSFEDICDSTLKHRSDLLASIDPASTFVSALFRKKAGSGTTAYVGIWAIPGIRANSSDSPMPELTAMVTYFLPESKLWSQEIDLECLFNPKATSLLVTGVKGVASYDFTSYTPRKTWKQQIPNHGLSSARINSSFIVTSATTSLTIHDTKFSSSRTMLDLTRIGKKRKRTNDDAAIRGFVRIIGYFRELGKLVTVRRNHLLSFEVTGGQKEAFLIDNIGLGVSEALKSTKNTNLQLEIGAADDLTGLSSQEWDPLQQKISDASARGDAAAFEAIALEAIQDPNSLDRLSEQQIEFLVSKIFRCVSDTEPASESVVQGCHRLEIALPAYTLLTMLIDDGRITGKLVQHALRVVPANGKAPLVKPGMIPEVLIDSDSSLALLKIWIDNAEILDAAELAAAAGTLVNLVCTEMDAHPADSLHQSLLEDGNRMDVDAETTLQGKSTRISSVNGPVVEQATVKSILIMVLEKLSDYRSTVVAEEFRSRLKRTQTLTLIQLLRQQLFEGHHTMSILQTAFPTPRPTAPLSSGDWALEPVLSLESTSKLLLACIDAVGPIGFFVDEEAHDEFMARLVPELRSETELATQGLEEASFLRGILRETMRYAESVDKEAFVEGTASSIQDAPRIVKPGTIVTIYSEPSTEQGDVDMTKGPLPLSSHAENTVTLTKTRKGGGQVKDRTLREIREMENRNKGVYSFERLVM